MSNIYFHPEEHGLTVIGEVEFSDGNYSFDTAVIWGDAAGNLLGATDAGCSCPSPFEGETLATLKRFTGWAEVNEWLLAELTGQHWFDAGGEYSEYDSYARREQDARAAIGALIAKIRETP